MNDGMEEERRRFHRILFNAEAVLTCQEQNRPCKIIDLSLHGALIQLNPPTECFAGSPCRLSLKLSEQACIEMQASISHVNNERLGLQCRSIDIDSISNLRRLIELNLGNSHLLERDFASLDQLDL